MALAPLLPAAAVAVGTLKVDAALPYVCTLPSGQQSATVRIAAAFPDRVVAGEDIRFTDVTTTVELPAAAVADLTALKAATVRPETRLTVGVAQDGQRAEATWSGTAQPFGTPAEGPLTLTTTGDVPILTTGSAGDLVLTAGNLDIDLALSTAEGAPTTPGALSVACVPEQEEKDRRALATVPVRPAATGEPGTAPAPSADPSSATPTGSLPTPSAQPSLPAERETPEGADAASDTPTAGLPTGIDPDTPHMNPKPRPPEYRPPAPTCLHEKPDSMSLSAYIAGYANARKLNGAALIPPVCVLVQQGNTSVDFLEDGLHFTQKSRASLSYDGLTRTPPFKATLLGFDFAPITATMSLEQKGPMTVASDMRLGGTEGLSSGKTYARVPLVLHVLDVEVNGTKLDVGPSCRTVTPLSSPEPDPTRYPGNHLVLVGRSLQDPAIGLFGYSLTTGGPLVGEVTIPAFKSCGANGENLDRLLTASISGPGNYIKQIQGQTCGILTAPPSLDRQCTSDLQPYVVPRPER
ncbi:DUF6801 domain-containing protein [Streptomyces sp. NPDC001744]|uniref:DUF6801 domain-containing protein n=1 Tax=Streptomyces sp. NPDC001744 TaxID=3364606 RepID=UPI0036B9B626